MSKEEKKEEKLKVINIGITNFYDSLEKQGAKVTQIEWVPPVKHNKEITDLLDKLL